MFLYPVLCPQEVTLSSLSLYLLICASSCIETIHIQGTWWGWIEKDTQKPKIWARPLSTAASGSPGRAGWRGVLGTRRHWLMPSVTDPGHCWCLQLTFPIPGLHVKRGSLARCVSREEGLWTDRTVQALQAQLLLTQKDPRVSDRFQWRQTRPHQTMRGRERG